MRFRATQIATFSTQRNFDVLIRSTLTETSSVCQAKGHQAQAKGEWANANWRMPANGSNLVHFFREWWRMAAFTCMSGEPL